MNPPLRDGRLSPADLVTILNAVAGFLAIALILRHWALHPRELSDGLQAYELKLAGALIGLGALCDVIDGLVARATWTSGLGDHLDCMADTVTFGFAPALLVAVAGFAFPAPLDSLALAAAATHLVAVIVRLARHAAAPHAPADGFVGLPSPIAAVGVLALLAVGLGPSVTVAGIFLLSALMLAGFRYPHQAARAVMTVVVGFSCFAVAVIIGLVPIRLASGLGLLSIVIIPMAVHVAGHTRTRAGDVGR